MKELIIASAQSPSIKGDIKRNIEIHLKFAGIAAANNASFIIFPELSLTGYERNLAGELAISIDDDILTPLSQFSTERNLIIAAGIPVKDSNNEINIGLVCFYPDGKRRLHTKAHLHPGEELYFAPGTEKHFITIGEEKIALAICADTNHPEHAEEAFKKGATIYAASVLFGEKGYDSDAEQLKGYASKFNFTVLLSNHSAETGGWKPAGKSAVWDSKGSLLCSAEGRENSILLINKTKDKIESNLISIS